MITLLLSTEEFNKIIASSPEGMQPKSQGDLFLAYWLLAAQRLPKIQEKEVKTRAKTNIVKEQN